MNNSITDSQPISRRVVLPGPAIALGAAAAATAVSPAAAQQKVSQAASQGDFAAAVQAAFAGDYTLDWRGGNVTLTAPIVLVASAWKFAFGIRMNGATITANFSDAAKYAISLRIAIVKGAVLQNVGIRNFQITDCAFRGTSAFAGALRLECLSNGSGIYSWLIQNVSCENHNGRAFGVIGSVFEGWFVNCRTTGGTGAIDAVCRGMIDGQIGAGSSANNWNPNANNPAIADHDKGLPSALYVIQPNFRDASGTSIVLSSTVLGQEPYDLTVQGGYIVSNGGRGIEAPAGIKLVYGTGMEKNNGGCGISVGYRGGVFRNVTAANPIANASDTHGMKYLVAASLSSNGKVVLEDCDIVDEGPGSGSKLLKIAGGGTVYLNRSGTLDSNGRPTDVDGTGPVVKVARYA
jgi:hypothetical protein